MSFPNDLYKGNSATTHFSIKQGDSDYIFKSTDIIRLGIKEYFGQRQYILKKEFVPVSGESTVLIHLTPKETSNIPIAKAILEVELEYNNGQDIKTIYQEIIELKGVVLDAE